MAGYLVLLALGMIIDHQFSLWNKHWYFSLPALAILAGLHWIGLPSIMPPARWWLVCS